jgi:hypothetical protein
VPRAIDSTTFVLAADQARAAAAQLDDPTEESAAQQKDTAE